MRRLASAGQLLRRQQLRGVASSSSSRLVAARADGGDVHLQYADGGHCTFHHAWLRDNCANLRHPSSRQKLRSATRIPGLSIGAMHAEDDSLHITWAPDGVSSAFDATWLRTLGDSISAHATPEAAAEDGAVPMSLPRFSYDELAHGGEPALWQWLSQLRQDGVTLLEGVPCEPELVEQVASLIGPVQPQIYGNAWSVVSQKDAINIAYTGEPLELHMDLMYYESPPGLQLLHCLAFDDGVEGGESTMVDAFAIAERFRREEPEAFATLARVPATFVKDHSDRAEPVLMSYQRSHLALDARSQLVGVFWSPPFEGPLLAPAADAAAYYDAYPKLQAAIDAAPALTHRLRPGEMIVFNNRRMLHGRKGFVQNGDAMRHLRGCYVNIDEFANRLNLLRRRYGASAADAPPPSMAHLGNQDAAGTRELGLPPRE